ncbi:hypothetical protein GQ457_03G032640 [Hibiscus cannabinus]
MQTSLLPRRICEDIEKLIRKFIWGSTDKSQKISLINWETLCQPLHNGGLGFRRIYDFNLAFILKIGYALVTQLDSFWICILRQKYKMNSLLPASLTRNNCSPLWRAIAKSWDILRDSIAWSIGNGTRARPLDDIWIPNLGPLRNHMHDHTSATQDLTFSDLINASGDWDIAKLQSIFTDKAISHIMGFKSPDPTDIDDSIIWPASNKNLFNIRSAHEKLASPLWDPKSPTWKTIWSLQVPQRLRLFAWLAYKQKLMTNSERCRRSIGSQSFCSICNLSEETTLHVLRDCATAKSVWMQLFEPTSVYNFFHSNLQEWNDMIFKAISHDPQEIASRSLTWARYYHNCKPPSILPRKHPLPPSRWQEPEPDWICLNVDAAVSPKSSSGSIGGVFRNHTGSWILGFQKQIGIVSILQTELWAIFIGLQIAWEQNFLFVTVQSDSMEAVNLLKKSQTSPSSLPLVRAIENLRKRSWELSIHWTPRQGNNVADALARQQDPHRKDLIIHEEPPPAILQFLNNGILNLSLQ